MDPCDCQKRCKHDVRCLGGHANYPGAHWYPCDYCWDAATHALHRARRKEAEK